MINVEKNKSLNKQLSDMYDKYAEEFLREYAKDFNDKNPPPRIHRFGIVDEECFDTDFKVLFIAKEPNGGGNDWVFLDWLRDGTRRGELIGRAKQYPTTWYNIGRWASLIFNPEQDIKNLISKKSEALNAITKIAFTNVNKVKGDSSSKRPYNNLAFSNIAIKVLSEEIKILKPHLIICCGTEHTVKKAISELAFHCHLITMPHPAAKISKLYLIEELKKNLDSVGYKI